ncbi:MAG: type I-C CRISPR-associated protein Cas5 [SAR202 cluster bacterium]|nr:type I-C CRISPR-associated protein Cas5 [SAR202 cluster bacterium]MBM3949718.1 type I-C CRISPR-associated protein Cas5 [SAR202 cluster bacterium]
MTSSSLLELRVWGEWACFTRPELKAERVSYPMMTPSAARGVLEAVFWKPEFTWRVHEMRVLSPIRTFSILRNEVNSKASVASMRNGYFADEDRAQRHTLALRDVAYLIRGDMALKPHAKGENPAKFRDQFRRRVAQGQCHHVPYLGCREFAACFGTPIPGEPPIGLSEDLGLMLFDLRYEADGQRATPVFFRARLEKGVLHVPQEKYAEVEVANATH